MAALLASILSPQPASMSSVRSPRTTSGRIPSGMRCRSSGGSRCSHSVRGTTPNIAPPSSAKKPSDSVDELEVAEREPPRRAEERHCAGCAGAGADRRLLQLDQHALCGRRMDEGDQRTLGARPRRLVDQPDARLAQLGKRGVDDRRRRGRRGAGPGRASRGSARSAIPARSPRGAPASPSAVGRKCARTCCDATSSVCATARPSAVAIPRRAPRRRPTRRCPTWSRRTFTSASRSASARPRTSAAAEYGSISRRAIRSTSASNSPGPKHRVLDMGQEPLRQQLAQAVFVSGGPPPRPIGARRGRRKRADRLPQLGHALARRRLGLDDRRAPRARRDRSAARGSTRST